MPSLQIIEAIGAGGNNRAINPVSSLNVSCINLNYLFGIPVGSQLLPNLKPLLIKQAPC